MPKPKRGKNARAVPDWRGNCTICQRTGVKLLWTKLGENNQPLKVCKRCGN